jgi:hypothetical protein
VSEDWLIAERCAVEGDVAGVWEACQAALAKEMSDAERFEWALLLAQVGLLPEARSVAQTIGDAARSEKVRALLSEHEARPSADSATCEEDEWLDVDLRTPGGPRRRPEEVDLFLRWFGGRRDVYARQWFDERRRRSGYHPVQEPLTPHVAAAHLEGRTTIGQYLLYPDATVSFAVLDLDVSASALEDLRLSQGDDAGPLAHPGLRSYALRLIEVAAGIGLPLFPEDSGARGLHLWLFFEPRRPARAARALLGQVLLAAGAQPPDVEVEIFPKQERVGPRGLSSLVKLPLGLHQATLRRCALLDEALRPIEEMGEALRRLRAAAVDDVDAVLGRRILPLPVPSPDLDEMPVALPSKLTSRSLAEALRAIEPGALEREACDRIISGCAIVGGLVHEVYEARRLSSDGARALVYTLGLVGPACRLVEDLFAVAQVSRKELERVRRGLPSPVGCAKLKHLFPELAKGCACGLTAEAQPYPSPALLAVGARAPAPPTWAPFAPWLEEGEPVAADPLDSLVESVRRIEERLFKLEQERKR